MCHLIINLLIQYIKLVLIHIHNTTYGVAHLKKIKKGKSERARERESERARERERERDFYFKLLLRKGDLYCQFMKLMVGLTVIDLVSCKFFAS